MREFVVLAENKNYTVTAEELYITQSALSRHINSMEEELGVQLINRSKNSFELTPVGQTVVEDFQNILTTYRTMLAKIAQLSNRVQGTLNLGILYYDASGYVSKILNVFRKHFPDVNLHVFSYQPKQMEEALVSGQIDAGFMYSVSYYKGDDICSQPFLKVPFAVTYGENHRFSQMEEVKVQDLNDEVMLQVEIPRFSRTDILAEKIFRENDIKAREIIYLKNIDERTAVLDESGGIMLLPAVSASLQSGLNYKLVEPDKYSMDVSVVWLKKNKNPLIDILCSAIKMCYS